MNPNIWRVSTPEVHVDSPFILCMCSGNNQVGSSITLGLILAYPPKIKRGCRPPPWTRNSSGDEIANVNFLRRHRTRTTAHKKVHFAYGKHTMSCPQLPNETLTRLAHRPK